MESSGSHFNRMALNMQGKNTLTEPCVCAMIGKPHNPMINSGALVLVSLLKPNLSLHERVDFVSHFTSYLDNNFLLVFLNCSTKLIYSTVHNERHASYTCS